MEVALLDRMIDLDRRARSSAYDLIVFDTAPTGHTLQLLACPTPSPPGFRRWCGIAARFSRSTAAANRSAGDAAAADPVLGALERRHERLGRLRTIITDRSRTSFVLVGIPERLVIEETARAAELLGDTGIDVGGLVVNRVLPDDLEGEFYLSRKAQERTYLEEIDRRFARLPPGPCPPAAARRLRAAVAHTREPAARWYLRVNCPHKTRDQGSGARDQGLGVRVYEDHSPAPQTVAQPTRSARELIHDLPTVWNRNRRQSADLLSLWNGDH